MKKQFVLIILILLQSLFAVIFRENHLENNAYSARAFALGRAGAALTDSIDNVFYSPASLQQKKANLYIKSNAGLVDVNQMALLSVIPLNAKEHLGFAYSRSSVGDIPIGEDAGTEINIIDKASYVEQAFFLSYAVKQADYSVAVTYKNLNNQLYASDSVYNEGKANGYDVDISIWKKLNEYQVAAGYKNVLSMLSKKGMISWENGAQESFDFGPYLGLSRVFDKILLVGDLRFSKLHNAYLNLGVEYLAAENVALRGGYNKFYGFSFGLGFNYNEVLFDYAFVPDYGTALDNKHYISAGYQFDAVLFKETNSSREDLGQGVKKKYR